MRWDALRLTDEARTRGRREGATAPPRRGDPQFDTPEFRGITFHEVTARSALNKVPEASACRSAGRSTPIGAAAMRAPTAHDGDTLVLMADGRAQRLSDVRAGDQVIGTEVRGATTATW